MMPLVLGRTKPGSLKTFTVKAKEKVVLPIAEYPNFGFSHYNTSILSLAAVRFKFLSNWLDIQKEFRLSYDDEEYVYDWIVIEALNNVLDKMFNAQANIHYRHDIYKCVYDYRQIGLSVEQYLAMQLNIHKLRFAPGQRVKTLVAGDLITLTKGVIPHA